MMVAEVIEVENDQTNQDAKFILVDESHTENYTDQTCGEWVENEESHPTPSSNQGLLASKASSVWPNRIAMFLGALLVLGVGCGAYFGIASPPHITNDVVSGGGMFLQSPLSSMGAAMVSPLRHAYHLPTPSYLMIAGVIFFTLIIIGFVVEAFWRILRDQGSQQSVVNAGPAAVDLASLAVPSNEKQGSQILSAGKEITEHHLIVPPATVSTLGSINRAQIQQQDPLVTSVAPRLPRSIR